MKLDHGVLMSVPKVQLHEHLDVGIMPALTLIGCVYLALAMRYWFRIPAIGIAIGTGCFAAAWVLSLS